MAYLSKRREHGIGLLENIVGLKTVDAPPLQSGPKVWLMRQDVLRQPGVSIV